MRAEVSLSIRILAQYPHASKPVFSLAGGFGYTGCTGGGPRTGGEELARRRGISGRKPRLNRGDVREWPGSFAGTANANPNSLSRVRVDSCGLRSQDLRRLAWERWRVRRRM